jgi:hypothetical protein
MRLLVVIATVGLAVTGSASAELVARVGDGMLAVNPSGAPLVSYVRGRTLVVSERKARDRWTARTVAPVASGSRLAAFRAGRAGPVAVVLGPSDRSLVVFRKAGKRWVKTALAGRLETDIILGWPGLALDAHGLPVVAYTRWNTRSQFSQLILARIDAQGKARAQRITAGGWPKSFTPPPAAPVVLRNGSVHVTETYGVSGAVGTIEWMPRNRTWIGLFLSAGRGGFPIGPMFAIRGRGAVVYAAWTEAFPGSLYGGFPATLARHGREITEQIVSERGLATGLVMTPQGPEVAANEWVSNNEVSFSFPAGDAVWAGTISGRNGGELDGRVIGLAAVPRNGARDLLLTEAGRLSWFRTPAAFPVHVRLDAEQREDGTVALSGHVDGAHGGHVTIYRERSGTHREKAGAPKVGAGGDFALVDSARSAPTFYRAVYTDPRSGIPYARLLRDPVGGPPVSN